MKKRMRNESISGYFQNRASPTLPPHSHHVSGREGRGDKTDSINARTAPRGGTVRKGLMSGLKRVILSQETEVWGLAASMLCWFTNQPTSHPLFSLSSPDFDCLWWRGCSCSKVLLHKGYKQEVLYIRVITASRPLKSSLEEVKRGVKGSPKVKQAYLLILLKVSPESLPCGESRVCFRQDTWVWTSISSYSNGVILGKLVS